MILLICRNIPNKFEGMSLSLVPAGIPGCRQCREGNEMGARSVRFKVLLVEDEVPISEMVAEVLAEQGFEVHAVGSATEALCVLKSGTSVDVLFTDINLGSGMDGVTLAMHARVMLPDLPVV